MFIIIIFFVTLLFCGENDEYCKKIEYEKPCIENSCCNFENGKCKSNDKCTIDYKYDCLKYDQKYCKISLCCQWWEG
jgi:hypothetical protein